VYGDAVSDVLPSVLARGPDWAHLPAALSPALGTYIRRCLHKDPRQRIHDIADVRLALEGASETAAPQTTASVTAPAPSRGTRLAWIVAAAAVLDPVALVIPAVRHLREAPPPETRTDIVRPATDSSRIVFDSTRKGPRDRSLGSSSRAGAEDPLLASPQDKTATDWSADGRFLLYQSNDPQTSYDLWVLPMEGDRPSTGSSSSSGRPEALEGRMPWVFLKTPFGERNGTFSPEGGWVAYMSNESGRPEIDIRPFAGPFDPSTGSGSSRASSRDDFAQDRPPARQAGCRRCRP
jgi:hypothetical protein